VKRGSSVIFGIILSLLIINSSFSLRVNKKQGDQQELEQEVTVTLKLVQVYVTDKKGNPVTDLNREDFVLYDRGKLQNITDFEKHLLSLPEEQVLPDEEVIEVGRMPRKFFLFFDFAFNDLSGIALAKEAALHFIDTQITPSDTVGIVTYSTLKGLVLHEYLTSDHDKIRELVKDIGVQELLGRAGRMLEEQEMQLMFRSERALMDERLYPEFARMIEDIKEKTRTMREDMMRIGGKMEFRHQALHFSSVVRDWARALRYIPGYKHIILFSSGIPNWLMYRTAVEIAPQLNKVNLPASDTFDLRTRYEDMSRELAVSNSPVYAVNVAGMYSDFMDREGKSVFSMEVTKDNEQPSSFIEDRNRRGITSLMNLAKDTGGKYYENTKSPKKSVEEIQTLTGSYYVLGYYINEKRDGKFHKIEVEVKRKGCKVYTQRGYFNPKPFKKFSDLEKKIHLVDLALSEKPMFGDPAEIPMVALPVSAENREKVVIVSESAGDIQGVWGENMEIVFVVFDEKQDIVGYRGIKGDDPRLSHENILPYVVLPLYPGKFECRVVMRNLRTGESAVASSSVFIPRDSGVGLKFFPPLWLTQEPNPLYLNVGNRETNSGEKEYSALVKLYGFDPAQYSPLVGDVNRGSRLMGKYRCSFKDIPDAELKLYVRLVHQPSGKKVPMDYSFIKSFNNLNGSTGILSLEIQTDNLEAGKYFLYLFAEDLKSHQKSMTTSSFTVSN
jgi:VWFA-related protein